MVSGRKKDKFLPAALRTMLRVNGERTSLATQTERMAAVGVKSAGIKPFKKINIPTDNAGIIRETLNAVAAVLASHTRTELRSVPRNSRVE